MRVADDQIGDHAEVIVGGEPVVGGQLVAGIAHDFVEAIPEFGAFAGEDVHPIGADDMHGSGIDAVAGEDALSRRDGIGSSVPLDSTDVHIHLGRESGMRIADHEVGDHAQVIVGSEPVVGGQLIGGIAHDRVETAPEDSTLASEDRSDTISTYY